MRVRCWSSSVKRQYFSGACSAAHIVSWTLQALALLLPLFLAHGSQGSQLCIYCLSATLFPCGQSRTALTISLVLRLLDARELVSRAAARCCDVPGPECTRGHGREPNDAGARARVDRTDDVPSSHPALAPGERARLAVQGRSREQEEHVLMSLADFCGGSRRMKSMTTGTGSSIRSMSTSRHHSLRANGSTKRLSLYFSTTRCR